jgi:hypothetical protein
MLRVHAADERLSSAGVVFGGARISIQGGHIFHPATETGQGALQPIMIEKGVLSTHTDFPHMLVLRQHDLF